MARRSQIARQMAQDSGATSAEYAVLASLIAGVIVSTVFLLGARTNLLFSAIEQGWP